MQEYEELRPGIFLRRGAGALPLTTDALLLADFTRPPRQGHIVDLGCGAGAISLLLCAEHPDCRVTGLELSASACAMARDSCCRSGLADRFSVIEGDLRAYRALFPPGSFDCVVSNPPYFASGQDLSRTETACTLEDLCAASAWLVKNGGSVNLVYRPERLVDLCCALRSHRLEPKRLQLVRHQSGSQISLVLLSARRNSNPGLTILPDCILYRDDGTPTDHYRAVCGL